jgi:beta-N-acetylhexosaminidase
VPLPLAAFAQALLAAAGLGGPPAAADDPLAGLNARDKAGLVVVSGLPAPRGVGGVFVRAWNTEAPRPANTLVFVDQEGADVRAFASLPPAARPSDYGTEEDARRAGRETGKALREQGVHVNLAPVLDLAGGPLGSRHYARPELALAFAQGLGEGGVAACVKHFPGLGAAARSTDDSPWVLSRFRPRELAAFGAAVREGVSCVMTTHAVFEELGLRRGLTSPEAHRMLRRLGFDGVIVTDSLSIVASGPWPVEWARRALRAGADLVLYTSPEQARKAIRALVPLAHAGALDAAVTRVLALRRAAGLPPPRRRALGRW